MRRLAGLWLVCLGALPVGAAEPARQGSPPPPPATGTVTLVCEAVYMPSRATWARTVTVSYDQRRIREVAIDGQVAYRFAVQDTLILTALDNERIQIDVAAQRWSSDFRGLATAQGRCERVV
jgi:hypothetical protein